MSESSAVRSTEPLTYCPLTKGEQSEKCAGCKVKLSVPKGAVAVVQPFDEGFFRVIPHGPMPFIQELLSLNGVQGYMSFMPSVRDWLMANIHDAGLGKVEQIMFVPYVNLSGQLKFWPITFSRERIEQHPELYKAEVGIAALALDNWVEIDPDYETGELSWEEILSCHREVDWTAQEINDAFVRAEFNNYYINKVTHPFILWALAKGESLITEEGDNESGEAAKGAN